ncbi:MAG TPA: hypothetical protein VK856_11190 [Anaerolineaceae bacterium]|nr:hypothetical protein [Anaerolineaceae bacterium]
MEKAGGCVMVGELVIVGNDGAGLSIFGVGLMFEIELSELFFIELSGEILSVFFEEQPASVNDNMKNNKIVD